KSVAAESDPGTQGGQLGLEAFASAEITSERRRSIYQIEKQLTLRFTEFLLKCAGCYVIEAVFIWHSFDASKLPLQLPPPAVGQLRQGAKKIAQVSLSLRRHFVELSQALHQRSTPLRWHFLKTLEVLFHHAASWWRQHIEKLLTLLRAHPRKTLNDTELHHLLPLPAPPGHRASAIRALATHAPPPTLRAVPLPAAALGRFLSIGCGLR